MNKAIGQTFTLNVKHCSQNASGGSYFVRFDAKTLVLPGPEVLVTFDSDFPNDPDLSDLEAAKRAIVEGFNDAMHSSGLGAIITVTQLTLHPVDVNPKAYGYWARDYMLRALASIHKSDD
jgi:hypothetical protein